MTWSRWNECSAGDGTAAANTSERAVECRVRQSGGDRAEVLNQADARLAEAKAKA